MSGPEFQKVEAPLIAQLVRMGWKHTTGNLDHPSVTGRGSFREVLLLGELRAAITRINLRDGKPWLDEDRVSQAVSELDRISKPKLMEANQAATQLLVKGCDVIGPFTSSAMVTLRPVPGLPELHVMSTLADYSPPDPAAKDKAPNAFLTNPTGTAVSVESGASVTIEGLLIKDSKLGIACVGSGNPTRVRVQRTLIAQSNVGIQTSAGCELSLDQSWIGEGPRERYTGLANSANLLALDLDGTKFDITNSVFNHNSPAPGQFGGILVRNATASTPGRIVNTSFVRHETASAARKALVLDCNPATTNITIANSLFLNSTALADNTYVHAACRGPNQKYIGSDDTSLTGEGNATDLVMSDVFTAPVSLGDMTLKMTADARVRDGGLVQFLDSQSGKNIIPTTDIIGAARSSTKLSLGAFEASR